MYCPKCGVLNSEDAKFCKDCGNPLSSLSIKNTTHYEEHKSLENQTNESVGAAYIVLSLLIPLIGFILYFSWKKEQPQKANSLLPWAFVGIVVNIILGIAGS